MLDAVAIADKDFYSSSNVAQLIDEGLRFIIPLRRASTLIDYSIAAQTKKEQFDGFFKFQDRIIWHYTPTYDESKVTVFLDQELKTREEKNFLDRTETCPDKFTIDKFYKKQVSFGTIALLSNSDKTPEKIY